MRRQIILAALIATSCSGMSRRLAQADGIPGNCAQLQDAEKAISSCTEFLNSHPDVNGQAGAYFYRGTAFSMIARYDEAIEDLGKAIEADPTWPLPHNNRARAFVSKGEPAKAIADYDQLAAINPRNAVVYVNRALAYMEMKDYDRALADLQKSDELKPNTAFVIYNIGEAYAMKGDLAKAEAEYRKALAITPSNQHVIDGLKRIGATP